MKKAPMEENEYILACHLQGLFLQNPLISKKADRKFVDDLRRLWLVTNGKVDMTWKTRKRLWFLVMLMSRFFVNIEQDPHLHNRVKFVFHKMWQCDKAAFNAVLHITGTKDFNELLPKPITGGEAITSS